MYSRCITGLLSLAGFAMAEIHGEGDEGTIMGPVAFLWPDDRSWDASYDNTSPCGSSAGVTNRTEFPLSQYLCHITFHRSTADELIGQGEVALSIADDAWKVAFYISFDNSE